MVKDVKDLTKEQVAEIIAHAQRAAYEAANND